MPLRTTTRVLTRAGIAAVVTLLAMLGLTGTALAHATLIGSDPAEGAVVTTAPSVVTLTFDDTLEDFEPTVVVTGPDGQTYQSGEATIDGATVSNAVAPLTAAGAYTIAYRVVSDDGHPVEGEVHFQFAGAAVAGAPSAAVSTQASGSAVTTSPATTSATPSSASSAGPSGAPTVTTDAGTAASSSSNGWGAWQWVALVLFVILAFGASMVLRRRMAARAGAGPGTDGTSADS